MRKSFVLFICFIICMSMQVMSKDIYDSKGFEELPDGHILTSIDVNAQLEAALMGLGDNIKGDGWSGANPAGQVITIDEAFSGTKSLKMPAKHTGGYYGAYYTMTPQTNGNIWVDFMYKHYEGMNRTICPNSFCFY